MTPDGGSAFWRAGVGICLALGLAWGSAEALSAFATPRHLKDRLAQLQAAADRTTEVSHHFGDITAYRAQAVCHQQLGAAAELLKTRIEAAAASDGVTSPSVTVSPPEAIDATGMLSPVLFEIDARGGYDEILSLLRQLANVEPQIFADTLDLKSETTAVSLKLTGRILCSPPRS